jgi:DNA polymerase-3 subunit alpha
MGVLDFAIAGDDKSFKEAYNQKILLRYYRRKVKKRSLLLSRDECIQKYGNGDFVHLNTHTKFSPLSGVDEPDDLFNNLKSLGMSAVGVTESGYMSSIPDCYLAAKSSKIKFISGICAYFSDYEVKRRELSEVSIVEKDDDGNDVEDTVNQLKDHPFLLNACSKNKTPFITILAKNEAGYKELLNLNLLSWSDGYYYTPRVTRKMLEKFNNGNLIILSGNLLDKFIELGYIKDIEHREYGAACAYDYMKWFHEKFGDDFYVELTMRCQDSVFGSDLDRMSTLMDLLESFKDEVGCSLKCIVTNDVFYSERNDAYLYRAMIAINRNSTITKIKDFSSELYLKNRAELRATYNECWYNKVINNDDFERACDLTLEIANKCSSFKADTSPKLPHIDNAANILRKLVAESLIKHGFHNDSRKFEIDGKLVTYTEQAKIELDRFIEKGFESYFLIMRDIIKFSHDNGWATGPSRGCCTPDSIINTINGKKRIDNININDYIYDGFNDIKKVLNVLKYNIDEELFNIVYNNKSINVTSDHKLYIIRDNKVMLCKASDIKITDELITQ